MSYSLVNTDNVMLPLNFMGAHDKGREKKFY